MRGYIALESPERPSGSLFLRSSRRFDNGSFHRLYRARSDRCRRRCRALSHRRFIKIALIRAPDLQKKGSGPAGYRCAAKALRSSSKYPSVAQDVG